MTSKGKELIKMLERLVKQDHLYDEEKIREIKSQLRILKQEIANLENTQKKGFGQ
jgi:hypothetical protein